MTQDDQLAKIQASLDESRVWVDPALRDLVSPDELAEIEGQLARTDTPTFLVLHELRDEDEFAGDPEELLVQLHDRFGEPGVYVAPRLFEDAGQHHVFLVDRQWSVEEDVFYAEQVAEHRHTDNPGDDTVDDLGAFLADWATLMADGNAEEIYDRDVRPSRDAWREAHPLPDQEGPRDVGGDDGDGVPAVGIGLGLGALVALLAVAAYLRLRRRHRTTLTLPASVVANVRAAYDARLASQARSEVLALGEAIDAADLETADHAASWQQALDHYDAATRVLDRGGEQPDVLDSVGVVVLCQRGRAALEAAEAGRAWTPAPVCYLNPLHPRPAGRSRVSSGGRLVDVPLCARCRADLEKGRVADVLDVERRGRALHYFESDAEPWAPRAMAPCRTTWWSGCTGSAERGISFAT